ncbi:MAG: TetR/AcrR family transcriptional regulator [Bacteroidia bacterium]|nr:TetR/AcrR family transcriptional regulator [Bacteroidia bacterium]
MKVSTKTKILEGAREKFNQKGYYRVTIRALAHHLGMQVSNITYHFPTQDKLLRALLDQLFDQLREELAWLKQKEPPSLYDFWVEMKKYRAIRWRYRFFWMEIIQILLAAPKNSSFWNVYQIEKAEALEALVLHWKNQAAPADRLHMAALVPQKMARLIALFDDVLPAQVNIQLPPEESLAEAHGLFAALLLPCMGAEDRERYGEWDVGGDEGGTGGMEEGEKM